MTSQRIDRILLALGVLLILASSYQLFFKTTQSTEGPALGTLTSTYSVVKTKNALAMDWRDALTGHEISENQLIYTDNNSSAEINFKQGGNLEIGENSLVKLQSSGVQQSLNLQKGLIRAKLDGSHPVKVQMNGEEYLVSGPGADIQINLQDEKGEIGVLSGEVKVESAGVTENLDTKSALSIDGDVRVKKNIVFNVSSPAKQEVKYIQSSETPISFLWMPAETATVSVSRTPAMEDAQSFSGTSGMTVTLEKGLHYYSIENKKGSSLIGSLRIVQEVAPIVLRPLTGEKINLMEGSGSKLLLQWQDSEKQNYIVEWNDGEAHAQTTRGASLQVPISRTGLLKWRLKISDKKRSLALWSIWQEIEVTLTANPTVPSDLSPHDVEFQTYDSPNEKIDMKWNNDASTELEVVNPKGETTKISSEKNNEEYLATMGGAYRWRARSLDNFLRTSEWSEWKTFVVEDLSGEKSSEGIQIIQLKKPDQSVTFSWKAGPGTVSVFELAKDPKFQKIVKRIEGKRIEAKVSIPEIGAFYWRSRQYLPDGTFQVSEPKKVIIEPVPAPDKPEKLPDTEIPIEDFPVKTIYWKRVFDFFLSSAYAAEDMAGMAKIVLPTEEDAKGFVVRIYKDKDLTDLAFEMELDSKEFIWKFARPGIYYWQYAVIDYWDRKSLFSDPAILTIKGELTPPPVKPRLLFPIRAQKLKNENLTLNWTTAPENDSYRVMVANDKKFTKLVHTEDAKSGSVDLSSLNLNPQLYFWRVWAFNKKQTEVKSNIGRFVIEPHLEKFIIADQLVWKKKWKKRVSLSWNPSMDSYSFKSGGESGKIDGHTLMGLNLAGTYFLKNGIVNAEIMRQTGKVFKSEEYLFQRLSLDYVYSWNLGLNHKIGGGIVVGQTSGQSYEINNSIVTAQAVSGLSFGAVIRDYVSFNETYEVQSKLQYLAGEITQLDLKADLIRHQKNFFFLGGVGFSSRSYSTNSGSQTSLKLSLGVGKEF